MSKPFIRNHQYNLIKKQVLQLQRACNNGADPKVIEAVQHSAQSRILESFSELDESQKDLIARLEPLRKSEEFQKYLQSLEPFLEDFSATTNKQIMKLFPKVKKLKVPDLNAIDFQKISYLGWVDIGTNKMFIVYHLDSKLVGVQGRYTPSNKGICFLCNGITDVALFSAITKSKPANASSDYYKAIGNYICTDSHECNNRISNVDTIEKFLKDVLY